MRRIFLSRKRMLLAVAALLALLLGLWCWQRFAEERSRLRLPPPDDLLQQALQQTRATSAYTYRLRVRLVTPQGVRNLSELEGWRVLPDRVHVKGKLFNTPTEIIRIGDTAYLKDPFSPKWLSFPAERLGETRVFSTELDPLALLDLESLPGVKQVRPGEEEKGLWVLECAQVSPRHPELATQFTDFRYRIGIDPASGYVARVWVEARGVKAPTQLQLELRLSDYGRAKSIDPPSALSTPSS
ncbi:hypothetical protein [Desulfothermobacter acidiphilus]|uniref:hypothetical protein n=1 Tax=Desulfothermobacter acidiphilus TaxID=1938353 RepID=UPI003F89F443